MVSFQRKMATSLILFCPTWFPFLEDFTRNSAKFHDCSVAVPMCLAWVWKTCVSVFSEMFVFSNSFHTMCVFLVPFALAQLTMMCICHKSSVFLQKKSILTKRQECKFSFATNQHETWKEMATIAFLMVSRCLKPWPKKFAENCRKHACCNIGHPVNWMLQSCWKSSVSILGHVVISLSEIHMFFIFSPRCSFILNHESFGTANAPCNHRRSIVSVALRWQMLLDKEQLQVKEQEVRTCERQRWTCDVIHPFISQAGHYASVSWRVFCQGSSPLVIMMRSLACLLATS